MALDYTRVRKGLAINDDTLVTEGTGVPSGNLLTEAGIGSIYLQNDDGTLWRRFKNDTNTLDDWEKMASEKYVDNAVGAGISWREPVAVMSNQASLPATTDTTIDGVAITDGMRILFANPALNNVYIAKSDGSGGFVYEEDSNQESVGDTVYVEQGSAAGNRFTFNAANQWVRTDQASQDEMAAIRAFIGKDNAGTESPGYTSTNYILNGDNLETAIGKLDNQLKSTNDNIGSPVAAGEIVQPSNTVNQNLQAIDNFIKDNMGEETLPNVTNDTVADTVNAKAVKWSIRFEDATGAEISEVLALSFGTSVDWNENNILSLGSRFDNKTISVAVVGGNLELTVGSPGRAATITVRRIYTN